MDTRNPIMFRSSMNKPANVKRLVLKNFEQPVIPTSYQTEAWTSLKEAVTAVLTSRRIETSQEVLYSFVENLYSNGEAEKVYVVLQKIIDEHVERESSIFAANDQETLSFLRSIDQTWKTHCQQISTIRAIYQFLDRTYVLQNLTVPSLWDAGMGIFRKHYMIQHENVRNKTVSGILMLIDHERRGDMLVDRSLVKSLIRMLCDLHLYEPYFKELFIQDTNVLYANEGKKWVSDEGGNTISDYLFHVNKRLDEERDRSEFYLDFTTRKQVIQTVETQLLGNHLATILSRGFDQLLDEGRTNEVKLLFALFSRVKTGLTLLRSRFHAYIVKKVNVIVTDPERDRTMVQALLHFKEQMDAVLVDCFSSNSNFVDSLRAAFEASINENNTKTSELIAKYIDAKLRLGNKESTEEELERTLDKIMVLFRYVHGKDAFGAYYKKDLSKRLLIGKSACIDAEKSMLSKLKNECGQTFTTKLEGMFKDMELSRELMVNFKHDECMDMTVNVLTINYWPTYPPLEEVTLPDFMVRLQEKFKAYYASKHSGRKLLWQHNLGSCLLKANFPEGSKELQVSQCQALCLLAFNESDELALTEIKDKTNIDDDELKRTLQSLACGKVRVLNKNPRGRDVEDGDRFSYNAEFKNVLFRIRINQVQMKETKKERETTEKLIEQDRGVLIDAAIVRIMKMRRKLHHSKLIAEIFEQLSFPASPTDLKKRIGALIDREFISRDADNSNEYHYVA